MQSQLRGLYAITDEDLLTLNDFETVIEQVLLGGARIIQYRDKSGDTEKRYQQAAALKKLCRQHNALLIINDDVELTQQVDADGVHIGKNDSTLTVARERLGADKIIGVSCYNQLPLALEAEQQGADYVAFGSFYSSSIKPDAPRATLSLLQQAKQQLSVPVCCIGGIHPDNANELLAAGADMLAVISAVFGADDIHHASQRFSALFK